MIIRRLSLTVASLSWLLATCASPTPTPSSSAPSVTRSAAPPSAEPGPTETVAVEPCEREQLDVTPGSSGTGLGTSYLKVYVELRQGPPCTIPWGPSVTILARDGSEVARASDTSGQPVELRYITRYYIAWSASGECSPVPARKLAARIEFAATLTIEIPVGDFRPTCVTGANSHRLAMFADE